MSGSGTPSLGIAVATDRVASGVTVTAPAATGTAETGSPATTSAVTGTALGLSARTAGMTGKEGAGVGKPLPVMPAIGASGIAAPSIAPAAGLEAIGMPVSPPGGGTTTLAVRKSANFGLARPRPWHRAAIGARSPGWARTRRAKGKRGWLT
ncbi:hypothetical protein P0F65_15240 [Sphingomonas sp. I4]